MPPWLFIEEPSDVRSLPLGLEIAGYRVEGLIGVGGFAVVYRGRSVEDHRNVALRFRHDSAAREATVWRETELWSRITHPNVVQFIDARSTAVGVMLVLELVEGHSLRHMLRSGPLSWQRALELGLRVLDGLEAIWRNGVTHRDVTPGNVLVGEGEPTRAAVKLTDLGLAVTQGEGGLHKVGTIGYAAPEQIRNVMGNADRSADIFGLAATMYRAAAGTAPFRAPNWDEYIRRVETGLFESPRAIVPIPFLSLLRSLLQPEPRHRFTVSDFRRRATALLR